MRTLPETIATDGLFESMHLLKAYEKAINANVISSITDLEGTILYANQKFSDASKYSIEAIVGQNHRIINSGYHPKEFFRGLWKTISKGDVWHDEIKNKASDGSFYWVDTVIVPIKNENDKVTHFLSLRTLITEKKRMEEKRRQYVDSLEVLLVMTSHNVKKPLTACLDQMNALNDDKPLTKDDLKAVVEGLKKTARQLDSFSKELGAFIRDMNQPPERH